MSKKPNIEVGDLVQACADSAIYVGVGHLPATSDSPKILPGYKTIKKSREDWSYVNIYEGSEPPMGLVLDIANNPNPAAHVQKKKMVQILWSLGEEEKALWHHFYQIENLRKVHR